MKILNQFNIMSLHDIKLKVIEERLRWLEFNCKKNFEGFNLRLGIGCFKNKANYLGSGFVKPNYSSLLRKINTIKYGKSKFRFASIKLNEYGKIEGAPGGYGSSIKNQF